MAINFYKDNKYPKTTKTNNTEWRENTYQPQTTAKKTVDNSSSMMYNKSKENTGIKQPTTLRDFTSSWKQKNESALKYAGDSAKKSVDVGLKEASNFMKDADEGTKFEDVQTASVKWNLANDSNNKKLSNIAIKEMIGHLSKENKEPYLKDVQPLKTYIDAKDEFDYKNNNYTTTENIDTTPHEGVRSIQRKLNEKGYTDKFGNALKEDGIYGGKTAYALDEFEKNNINKIQSNIKSNKNENFSINNISEKDWLKIANALGYTNEDLNVAALAYNDKGEFMVPASYASASGVGDPIYKIVNDIINSPLISQRSRIDKIINRPLEFKNLIKYGDGTEKNNNKYQIINYIIKKSTEEGIPIQLALATAFTESSFIHFKGNAVNENNGDYGLMQININAHPKAFEDKTKYGDIVNNWHDNVDYGLIFLKQCYNEARSYGYTGNDLIKATYSNYNSGSCSAYKNPSHQAYNNVNNFWGCYTKMSWK